MKWLLFCFVSSLCFSSPIIFVHMGKASPDCIFTTMEQAHYLNEKSDVYLLTDGKNYELMMKTHSEFFTKKKIDLVNLDLVPISEQHQRFREINKIDPSVSEGFWVYTTERFFALLDFMIEKNLEDVLHLESDTMLYVEFEKLLPLFANSKMAAPFQSEVACIPCFVFIRDAQSLLSLTEHILDEISLYQGKYPDIDLNDMQTLASFYKRFGREVMLPLPTLMQEYERHHRKRKSLFLPDNKTVLSFLSQNGSLFSGYLFDAASLGIFINGHERKNIPGTIHRRSLFDPGIFTYFWGKDEKGRDVPYLSFLGKEYQIVNLHFHSKRPHLYASFRKEREPFFSRSLPCSGQ